jgi:hypothetical protein
VAGSFVEGHSGSVRSSRGIIEITCGGINVEYSATEVAVEAHLGSGLVCPHPLEFFWPVCGDGNQGNPGVVSFHNRWQVVAGGGARGSEEGNRCLGFHREAEGEKPRRSLIDTDVHVKGNVFRVIKHYGG